MNFLFGYLAIFLQKYFQCASWGRTSSKDTSFKSLSYPGAESLTVQKKGADVFGY
jgi:hypothetical protein